MAADELLDVFDEMGRATGVADRRTVHARGLWHQVFHLLIVARGAGPPTVVLQRRATTKVAFPGLLDLSATGHLAAGETPEDGVRELREELGVDVDPRRLVRLGVRRIVDQTPEGTNRELCHVFLVHDDRPLDAYHPDPAEVDAVIGLPIDDGLDLMAGIRDEAVCPAVRHGDDVSTPLTVARGSFVPDEPLAALSPGRPFGYWTTLLVMASRSAAGDPRLGI